MFLWWCADDPRLAEPERQAIRDGANEVFLSAASVWEMAIKQARGKLRYPAAEIALALRNAVFLELPITVRHAEAAADLPPLHRDPFDRMLVAQAQVKGLSLVSRDPAVRQYQVTVLWGPELEAPRATYRVKRKPRRR